MHVEHFICQNVVFWLDRKLYRRVLTYQFTIMFPAVMMLWLDSTDSVQSEWGSFSGRMVNGLYLYSTFLVLMTTHCTLQYSFAQPFTNIHTVQRLEVPHFCCGVSCTFLSSHRLLIMLMWFQLGVPAFTAKQPENAMAVLKDRATEIRVSDDTF